MSVPKHHELMVDAAFLASGNEGITKFVRVMFRKQPLECGAQGIDVPDVLMDAFIAGLFEKIKELMSADKSKEEKGE